MPDLIKLPVPVAQQIEQRIRKLTPPLALARNETLGMISALLEHEGLDPLADDDALLLALGDLRKRMPKAFYFPGLVELVGPWDYPPPGRYVPKWKRNKRKRPGDYGHFELTGEIDDQKRRVR